MNMTELLAEYLEKRIHLGERQRRLLRHGIETLFSDQICFGSVIIISVILDELFDGVLFVVLFSMLRTWSGGWHAHSKARCLCSYILTFAAYLLMIHQNFHRPAEWLFPVISGLYICFASPVEHRLNPLSISEREHNRKAAAWCTLLLSLTAAVLYCIHCHYYQNIICVMVLNAGMMIMLRYSPDWRYYEDHMRCR